MINILKNVLDAGLVITIALLPIILVDYSDFDNLIHILQLIGIVGILVEFIVFIRKNNYKQLHDKHFTPYSLAF